MLFLLAACVTTTPFEGDRWYCELHTSDLFVSPESGAQDVYYRTAFDLRFSTAIEGVELSMAGPMGPVEGESAWSGSTLVFSPAAPLQPSSDYSARLTAPGCAVRELSWHTSELGTPVDPAELDGVIWRLDRGWPLLFDRGHLFSVAWAGGSLLTISRGLKDLSAGQPVCLALDPFAADYSYNPFFVAEVPAMTDYVGDGEEWSPVRLYDVRIQGTFAPDLAMEAVTWEEWISSEDLAEAYGYDLESFCDYAEGLGYSCEHCPRGEEASCVHRQAETTLSSDPVDDAVIVQVVDDDDDGFATCADDCDDADPAVNPGADEVCNGIDDDCDGEVDGVRALDAFRVYADSDGDGHGDASRPDRACEVEEGWSTSRDDCDDADATSHPDAVELCDGADNDCEGVVDQGLAGMGSACPGRDCAEVLERVPDATDGTFWVDAGGLDPFEVGCDMAGGGWTRVGYLSDLDPVASVGSGWQWLSADLGLELEDAQVAALRDRASEGRQSLRLSCDDRILYFEASSSGFAHAAGLRLADGTETTYGSSSYAPYDIAVSTDSCSAGGEGETVFELDTRRVPVVNVLSWDDGSGGTVGAALVAEPAWLR